MVGVESGVIQAADNALACVGHAVESGTGSVLHGVDPGLGAGHVEHRERLSPEADGVNFVEGGELLDLVEGHRDDKHVAEVRHDLVSEGRDVRGGDTLFEAHHDHSPGGGQAAGNGRALLELFEHVAPGAVDFVPGSGGEAAAGC